MNKREYKRLQAYAEIAKELQRQVDNLERLYRAVRYRAAEKKVPLLQVGVSVPIQARMAFGQKYDAGCQVNVPLSLVRDRILPVLREALKDAKAELAALPAVEIAEPAER